MTKSAYVVRLTLNGLLVGAVQAGGRPPGVAREPVCVARNRRVADMCPNAAAVGVKPGMAVSYAQRLEPSLRVVPLPAVLTQALHDRLETFYRRAYAWSPRVQPEPPLSLYFDLRLAPGRHRGLPLKIRQTLERLAGALVPDLGYLLQAGVAANPFLARSASQLLTEEDWRRQVMTQPVARRGFYQFDRRPQFPLVGAGIHLAAGAAVLAPLSTDFLWPLPPAVRRRLRDLGLLTVGDLAATEAGLLQEALGPAGLEAAQLASGGSRPVAAAYVPRQKKAGGVRDGNSQARGLVVGEQMTLWPEPGSLAGRQLVAQGIKAAKAQRLQANGRQRSLPTDLVRKLSRQFPAVKINQGNKLESSRREQRLSYWDPWRWQSGFAAANGPDDGSSGVG